MLTYINTPIYIHKYINATCSVCITHLNVSSRLIAWYQITNLCALPWGTLFLLLWDSLGTWISLCKMEISWASPRVLLDLAQRQSPWSANTLVVVCIILKFFERRVCYTEVTNIHYREFPANARHESAPKSLLCGEVEPFVLLLFDTEHQLLTKTLCPGFPLLALGILSHVHWDSGVASTKVDSWGMQKPQEFNL